MLLILDIFVAIAGGLVFIYLLADRAFSAPRYQGPVTDHFELQARIENLTDEKYETIFRYGTPGRASYVGVRFSY